MSIRRGGSELVGAGGFRRAADPMAWNVVGLRMDILRGRARPADRRVRKGGCRMPTRIGLMGLGRIGRNIFRILYNSDDIRIEAISDVADLNGLVYLLRFDTILGRFPDEVSARDGNLHVAGRQIKMLPGEAGGPLPWGGLGVDIVIEATRQYRTRAEMERHLEAGAKRVILCSPEVDPPDATVDTGANAPQPPPR